MTHSPPVLLFSFYFFVAWNQPKQQKAQLTYESQKQKEELTEAEAEELEVRKRRAEGTSCTDETFSAWRDKFDAEMKAEKLKAEEEAGNDSKKKGAKDKKVVDKSGRLTGYEQFSGKLGTLDWEAMEAANENAQRDEDEADDDDDEEQDDDDDDDDVDNLEDVNEELFDVDDDDLDDLDFDDDDDDDDEDEPDI